jgi:ubiquinone/menaquinone biosynthesis C-methylase UbiE
MVAFASRKPGYVRGMVAQFLLFFTLSSGLAAQQCADNDRVIQALNLKPGASVADVGAGSGRYAVKLARAVGPSGHVYAEDIDENNALPALRKRIAEEGLTNVTVTAGEPDDPKLPRGALDLVLMVDAYHEMDRYPQMLARVLEALKPGARLVVIDMPALKVRDRPRAVQFKNHVLAPELAEVEIRQAGFEILKRDDSFVNDPDKEGGKWLIVARRPPAPAQ